jgi:hypothetical protein
MECRCLPQIAMRKRLGGRAFKLVVWFLVSGILVCSVRLRVVPAATPDFALCLDESFPCTYVT